MSSWADFERAASEFASAGRRLLVGSDGTAIAFLATVATAPPRPHLCPVCPIFCGDHLYLSAATKTKVRDLRDNGQYVLHVMQHGKELQRTDRTHADMILLPAAGRDRIHAGRVAQHLVFRNQRCGRVLRDHEARIDPLDGQAWSGPW